MITASTPSEGVTACQVLIAKSVYANLMIHQSHPLNPDHQSVQWPDSPYPSISSHKLIVDRHCARVVSQLPLSFD